MEHHGGDKALVSSTLQGALAKDETLTDTLALMSRALVLFLTLASTLLILVGGLTIAWWAYHGDGWSVSVGLRETVFCSADLCQTAPTGGQDGDAQWVRAGAATYAASWLACGLLLALLVTVLVRRRYDLIIKTAMVACAAALVSGVVFVLQAPDYDGMSAGYSLYCYFAGCALGGLAGFAWLRSAHDSEQAAE